MKFQKLNVKFSLINLAIRCREPVHYIRTPIHRGRGQTLRGRISYSWWEPSRYGGDLRCGWSCSSRVNLRQSIVLIGSLYIHAIYLASNFFFTLRNPILLVGNNRKTEMDERTVRDILISRAILYCTCTERHFTARKSLSQTDIHLRPE
jgi:hypothetical protein